jgi:hypothetical protein
MSHRANGASPALRKNIIGKRQEVFHRKDILGYINERYKKHIDGRYNEHITGKK